MPLFNSLPTDVVLTSFLYEPLPCLPLYSSKVKTLHCHYDSTPLCCDFVFKSGHFKTVMFVYLRGVLHSEV